MQNGSTSSVQTPNVTPNVDAKPKPPINPALRAAMLRRINAALIAEEDRNLKTFLASMPEPQKGTPPYNRNFARHKRLEVQGVMNFYLAKRERLLPRVEATVERGIAQCRAQMLFLRAQTLPVNDLPTEILVNIFRYVVWSTGLPDVGVSYRLSITWVCKHWRSIAIEDNTLWTAIWFRDRYPYERSFAWFERAGNAPLDIRINEEDPEWNRQEDSHPFSGERMRWLLDKLFTKFSQIRMLIVIIDTWAPAIAVLDKLRKAGDSGLPISMMRFELHRTGNPYVWVGPGYDHDLQKNPIVLFGKGSAPEIKYIALNGVHVNWFNSPLSNLTTLDLRRIALEVAPGLLRFRDMLKASPNLRKLTLDGAGPRWEPGLDHSRFEPIELPNVVILVLGDFSLAYARYITSHFTTPLVRDFTLMNLNGEDYAPLLGRLTGKLPNVQLLTLYTVEAGETAATKPLLINWLLSMPLCSYLRVAQVKPDFLGAFLDTNEPQPQPPLPFPLVPRPPQPVEPNPIVCPRMNILEYQNMEGSVIIGFIKRRAQMGIPVKKVYVDGPWVNKVTPEVQSILRSLTNLYIAPVGSSTEEEIEILGEFDNNIYTS